MKFRLIIVLLLASLAAVKAQVVNVDPYTGQATTTIPLWTLKSGSLSYPIMLYNVSGGIKTDAYAGAVGIGWRLSSGFISRTLRGLPDDYVSNGTPARQGWLVNNTGAVVGGFVPTADDNLANCADERSDFNFLNSLGRGFSSTTAIRDTEPDIYSINTPGLSGSFTFDNQGELVFISKSNYKVSYIKDGNEAIVNFQIVNEAGVIYTFGRPAKQRLSASTDDEDMIKYFEHDYNLYKSLGDYNVKWSLVLMESPNGDRISFEYDTPMPTIDYKGNTFLRMGGSKSDGIYASYSNQSIDGDSISAKQYILKTRNREDPQFSKAIGRTESVELTTSMVALPMRKSTTLNQPVVGEISILSKRNGSVALLRKFKLDYETVEDARDMMLNRDHYILLHSVTEISQTVGDRPYVFSYFGVKYDEEGAASIKLARSKDEYGYFSDYGARRKMFVYPDLSGADRIRNKPVSGHIGQHYEIPGNSPELIDLAGLNAFSLSQVTLPTGGANRIFYEPHYYYDVVVHKDYHGGGLRTKSIEMYDGVDPAKTIITEYDYEEDDGTSSGVLLYNPLRAFTTNAHTNWTTGATTYYDALVNGSLSNEEIVKRTTIVAYGPVANASSDTGIRVGYRKVTLHQIGAGKNGL